MNEVKKIENGKNDQRRLPADHEKKRDRKELMNGKNECSNPTVIK
jgi:hypothetical protein